MVNRRRGLVRGRVSGARVGPAMKRTMMAAVLETPGRVEGGPLLVRAVPVPEPGPGEVLVRVHACGVCRTDLHVVEGELPVRRPQVIPGHQAVGAVESLGSGVK